MNQTGSGRARRGVAVLLLAALLFGVLPGARAEWEYRPITDVSNLEGRRVGVMLGYEVDYALTGREDLELFRYDTIADMVMALNFDKLDALAVDDLMWKVMSGVSVGLARVAPLRHYGIQPEPERGE